MNEWWQRYFGNPPSGGGQGVFPTQGAVDDNLTFNTPGVFDPPTSQSFPDQQPRYEWPVVRNETPLFLSPPWEDQPGGGGYDPSYTEPPNYGEPSFSPNQMFQLSMQDSSFQSQVPPWQEPDLIPGIDTNVYPPGVDDAWQGDASINTPDGSMVPPPNFFDPNSYAPPDYGPGITQGDVNQVALAQPDLPGPGGFQWPFDIKDFPSGNDYAYQPAPGTGYPTPPGVTPDVLPAQPVDHPGIHTSDLVHALAQDRADQGLGHQLGLPTRYGDVGKFIKDAAGNIVDATGKIVASAGRAATDFVRNVMNDPRNTTPDYLASMGYHEMDSGEMLPFSFTGPTVGAADIGAYGAGQGGGSYFHGGASAGMQHGATSVAGAGYGLGAGPSPINLAGTTLGRSMDIAHLRRLMSGKYTSPKVFGDLRSGTGIPMRPSAPGMSFQQYHQGQVDIGNFLRANPQWITQNFGGHVAGQGPVSPGPPTRLSTHTPRTQTV